MHDKKLPKNLIVYIKKFWSYIMNNEQLFDLKSPPSAEFDTAQELLRYWNNYAKQKGYALATKSSKREKNREKRPQSNLILEQITEKLKNIQSQKNEGKHHPGSTIAHLKYRAKNVYGKWRFVVKVPNHNHHSSPPEAHPMHQHLDDTGHCCGHFALRGMGHNSKTSPELL